MIERYWLEFGPLAGQIVLSSFVTWWLARRASGSERRPNRPWRIALPIPVIIWAFCVYIFIDASTASQEECGVDACGMAIAAAMMVGIMGILLYLIGVGTSVLTYRLSRQRTG